MLLKDGCFALLMQVTDKMTPSGAKYSGASGGNTGDYIVWEGVNVWIKAQGSQPPVPSTLI